MQIWQEMEVLKYYDHSYLAQMLGDEPEDVTIPKSIGALEALGELCWHSKEEKAHPTIRVQDCMIPTWNRRMQEVNVTRMWRWM